MTGPGRRIRKSGFVDSMSRNEPIATATGIIRRVRRAPAVVQDLRVAGVALLRDVLGEGVEQVAEQRNGKGVVADHLRQLCEHRVGGRLARGDPGEVALVDVQPREPDLGDRVAFVRDVVGRAGEAVDRLDRLAQPAREQDRGDGKVFVVTDRHAGSGVDSEGIIRCFLDIFRREGGGIGRRTGFRFRRREACGFESLPSHQTLLRIEH